MSDDWGHRRKVTNAVTDLLKRYVPQVNGRVMRARTWNLQDHEHPALLVYGWQEEKRLFGIARSRSQYQVNPVIAVEVRVLDRSRDGEEVEADLETLADAVCEAVMKAPELLGPGGLIERIEGVRTTFGINTKDSEVALGRALVAFEMKFSEQYDLRTTEECDCLEVVFRTTPDPSVP